MLFRSPQLALRVCSAFKLSQISDPVCSDLSLASPVDPRELGPTELDSPLLCSLLTGPHTSVACFCQIPAPKCFDICALALHVDGLDATEASVPQLLELSRCCRLSPFKGGLACRLSATSSPYNTVGTSPHLARPAQFRLSSPLRSPST